VEVLLVEVVEVVEVWLSTEECRSTSKGTPWRKVLMLLLLLLAG